MSQTHFYKKLVGWELLNVTQKKILKSAKESKTMTFQDKTFKVFDMRNKEDYHFFISATSDRGIVEVLESKDIFRGRPYLSCSVMTKETGSFKVNPGLLQAKLILQFNPAQVVYAMPNGFWSPTDKYNSRAEQASFIDKLQKQMRLAHNVEEKLRSDLIDEIGGKNRHQLTEVVQQRAERLLDKELLKNIKGEKIDLKPVHSPQTLVRSTLLNTKNQPTPYNEVILVNSRKVDYQVLAIAFEDNDFENAMRAAGLGNHEALVALKMIVESNLPIIVVKSNHQNIEVLKNSKNPESQLECACKVHDVVSLETLCKSIDVSLYGGKALQEACYLGHFEMVKILVKNGADVNYNAGMPIQAAFYRGFFPIAEFLIKNGADTGRCYDKLIECLGKRPNQKLSDLIAVPKLTEKSTATLR